MMTDEHGEMTVDHVVPLPKMGLGGEDRRLLEPGSWCASPPVQPQVLACHAAAGAERG